MCDLFCLNVKKNTTQLNTVKVGLPEAIPIYLIIILFIFSKKAYFFINSTKQV